NPGLLALLVCAVVFARAPRSRWLLIAAIPVAAIAAFAPHSILPNHKFAEYAWAAAPLFLAPILLLGQTALRPLQVALTLALSLAAIIGPWGYHRRYGSGELAWILQQERMGGAFVRSLPHLRDIHPPARVLVAGLTDPAVPWQVVDFVRLTFGEQINWTVVLPPEATFRRGSRVVAFVDPAEVNPAEYDYIATYRPSGELVAVRDAKTALATEPPLALAVPAIAPVVAKCGEAQPRFEPLLECASAALQWGRAADAARFIARAERAGGKAAANFDDVAQRAARMAQEQAAKTITGTLITRPDTIVSSSGVGIAEVMWEVPEGLAVEIHVDAPDGPLFAAATRSGSARTAEWVKDGMQFYLQNVTGGKPLTPQNTLATAKVRVTR
ncbi:MAG TPA: hypothetical protein VER03_05510, partial [Bryobacteraceae bacterium]|nr:hypothetical protein [Bryobacteraceae bacterium]